MSKQKNPVWRFFASVKLALITLIILAVTSIIGTLIKQGQAPSYYVQEYGPDLASVLAALDITNMYGSWWYVALLLLFAANLITCSIERLPGACRLVFQDNLKNAPPSLEKMSNYYCREVQVDAQVISGSLKQAFSASGWREPRQVAEKASICMFVQKGAWTRLGVYVVHLSILIVLIGALIGNLFGMQAYVFVPEERSVDSIYLRYSNDPVPLGFQLFCDRFEKSFYPNGMIKQYHADLTVVDQDRGADFRKSIIVNDPLSYRGLNFYIGDAYPTEEFFIAIRNRNSGEEQAFRVPPERAVLWQETGVSFRIDELRLDQDGVVSQAKISFAAEHNAEPTIFWIADKGTVDLQQSGTEFSISFRQYQAVFLLVTKDPGVWTVYTGSAIMIIGLFICFFMTHRRIWVQLTLMNSKRTFVQIGGLSNKNKVGFEQQFQKLLQRVEQALEDTKGEPKA